MKRYLLIIIPLIFLGGFTFYQVPNHFYAENNETTCLEDSLLFVRVIVAGDAMCHEPQFVHAKVEKNSYDFSDCFKYINDILDNGDLNIINFETTLAGAPYSGYPNFCAPDEFALSLRDAGFNFFLLANNHCADKGTKGTTQTIEKLKQFDIKTTGTFLNDEDRDALYPAIIEKNDITMALLNYTYGTNGLTVNKPVIINYLEDTAQIKTDLENAKLKGADIILVFLHWGIEYQQTPSSKQKEQAQFFFKNGADIIIGSHPHVIQPVEYFNYDPEDSTKTKLIYWSLGNFISNQRQINTDGGIMASFTIVKNKNTLQTHIENHTHIPYWVYRNTEISPGYFVIPTEHSSIDSICATFSSTDKEAFLLFKNNTEKLLQEK